MPTFVTPGPIAATIEVAGAQLRVTASDRTETRVLVEPLNAATRKDVKVAENTTVDFAGGLLSVKTTVAGDKQGSVAITIDLPAGSSLAAYLAHSDVRAVGTFGGCELHMASGRVHLDHSNALRANIASGEVTIDHIDAGATIDGVAFTMRIGEVDGPVELSNSGGQVWIGHAAADLNLSSASCDFTVDHADADITVTTASGAIRIGRMTYGQAKLMNGSGNIEIGIGEGVDADIEAKSERGSVHNSVTSPENPDPSQAKVSIHARTRHGDISIHRAAR